jgi:hypothetical protein
MAFAARRGRPRKFTRPTRIVTLTLPEDALDALAALDADLARAIVRLVKAPTTERAFTGLEVSTFGSRAVIVVNPTRALSAMKGVELVPLGDGRSLIALEDGMSEPQFELAVRDALDGNRLSVADHALLERLAAVLREARQDGAIGLRRIMVLHASAPAGVAKRPAGARAARR